jgi:uncharacterized membrane protein (Fun14 family)
MGYGDVMVVESILGLGTICGYDLGYTMDILNGIYMRYIGMYILIYIYIYVGYKDHKKRSLPLFNGILIRSTHFVIM